MILTTAEKHTVPARVGNAISGMSHVLVVGFIVFFPVLSLASLMGSVPDAPRRTLFAAARLVSPPPPPPPPPPAESEPVAEPEVAPTPPPEEPPKEATPVEPEPAPVEPEPVASEPSDHGVEGGVEGGVPGGVVSEEPPPPPAPTPQEPVRMDMRSEAASPLVRVDPVYPRLAVDARVQGMVILDVLVSETGVPNDVQVLRGESMLQQAAINAVQQWRWSPHVVAGRPLPFRVTVTVQFLLLNR